MIEQNLVDQSKCRNGAAHGGEDVGGVAAARRLVAPLAVYRDEVEPRPLGQEFDVKMAQMAQTGSENRGFYRWCC